MAISEAWSLHSVTLQRLARHDASTQTRMFVGGELSWAWARGSCNLETNVSQRRAKFMIPPTSQALLS